MMEIRDQFTAKSSWMLSGIVYLNSIQIEITHKFSHPISKRGKAVHVENILTYQSTRQQRLNIKFTLELSKLEECLLYIRVKR